MGRFCKNCGKELSENDSFCPNCGTKLEYWNVSENSPNTVCREGAPVYEEPNATLWIVIGVLSAIFCCLIGGIITTVFAVKADRFQKEGKFYPAATALEMAEGWFAFTMIIWVIEIVIGIIAAIIF